MKRRYLYILLPLLVLVLAGTAYGWQGRMGGMGDPYGLVADESDYLIHPAKIADGTGTRLYGDYRFKYRGVPDWSYSLDWFDPTGTVHIGTASFDTSGNEQRHDGSVGIAFPVGSGRMGIFFDYAGKRGDYDGNGFYMTPALPFTYDLTSDLDAFTLRLLYGLPVGSFKLGGEAQLSYRQEKNETLLQEVTGLSLLNNPLGSYNFLNFPHDLNLFPFMLPYDSSYLEALFKGSLEGAIGPLVTAFTLRGGVIFGGENQLRYLYAAGATPIWGSDLDGDVQGWRIGGDLWLRYPLAKDRVLPFLVRLDYQQRTRDGGGWGAFGFTGNDVSYESEETALKIEVGGGIDTELAKGTRLAAGVYYNYLNSTNDFLYQVVPLFNWTFDSGKCPDSTEHQVMLRLAGEHEFSSMVALRMGLNFFYGWVKEGYEQSESMVSLRDDLSVSGSHWGIGASVGGTIKFKALTLEPFVGGGYQASDLNGHGNTTTAGIVVNRDDMDKTEREWFVTTGLSIVFGL
jgi:hypothetical protein